MSVIINDNGNVVVVVDPSSNGDGALVRAMKRNKYHRKKKRGTKFKQKTIVSRADGRWSQHHGYNRKRLEDRKKRATSDTTTDDEEKKNAIIHKTRKRSHKAIHNRRHAYFTLSKGAHCIGIKPTRLEEHMRRRLKQAQIKHARLLFVDVRNGHPVRLSPEFINGVTAMVDGLREKVLERMAMFAAHRQSGRSKSPATTTTTTTTTAKPSYMGMMSDLVLALHTIISDAKK
jgi:hypothetical protein